MLTLKTSVIYFELILAFEVMAEIHFIAYRYLVASARFVEKIIISPLNYIGPLSKVDYISVGLFLDSLFYSTDLCAHPSINIALSQLL